MKKIGLFLFLVCLVFQGNAQNPLDDALTAASYAYSHSKKAYGANNVFHTQEYADKAAEAFSKVEALTAECGCTEANELAYQAKTDMESSLEQDTFERSKYYTKQAKELCSELLKQLTLCQANARKNASQDIVSTEGSEIEAAAEELSVKQQELEEKKRQLALQQQQLEAQIAEQQKAQKELEAKRAQELQQQAAIKNKAEQALKKLELAIQELTVALNEEADFKLPSDYSRSESELQNESLDETKSFYVNRAKELTKTAMQQFANYTDNE
ncbi:hypothetical protein [Aquimarina brevivitae]|uniref:DUF4398 domain-containing protein n=1 Tax=Aquimarina brevivitae TaxID=323412 RepID=A0A4Q7NZ67_9FLAO|nr:hypothetical protein [Aquimarina brevivitae]RZS92645.1 hypothetical protein EV197_2783 [Aquimarina brevivitae]